MNMSEEEIERIKEDLGPKRVQFCHEYLKDFNGAAAARRAGYSETAAKVTASELLTNGNVEIYLNHIRTHHLAKTGLTVQRVLDEIEKIAFANVQDYLHAGNEVRDISKIDADKAAAVAGIEITETVGTDGDGNASITTRVKFKLHDKLNALEKAGRYLGMWGDRVEINPGKNAEWVIRRPKKEDPE